MKLHKRTQEIILFAVTCVVLLMVAINSNIFFWRFDLTENRAYTVSKISKETVRALPETVSITYYLSDRLRTRLPAVQQIADILYQYSSFSGGRIDLQVIDPAESNVGDTQLDSLGLVPRQIQVIEQDQQSVATVYSGVVISYLDRYEALPFIINPAVIEYEVTTLIRDLVEERDRVVGILVGDDNRNLEEHYQGLYGAMQDAFSIVEIAQSEPIPPQVVSLIVLGVGGLNDTDTALLDEFVTRGGSVLYAIEGVTVDLDFGLNAAKAGALPVLDLLEHWGVRIRQELLLDESNLRIPLQRSAGGSVVIQTLEAYPYWVASRAENVNDAHSVTAQFGGLDLYWASPIEILDTERVIPLVSTSENAWIGSEPFQLDPNQAASLQFIPGERKQHPVVVAISGRVESLYSDAVNEDAQIVVISDVDFVSGLAQYTNSTHNITFMEQLTGWLSNDAELVGLRARTLRDARLNKIGNAEIKKAVADFAVILNVVLIPLLVILFGVGRAIVMRRKYKKYDRGTGPIQVQDK